jgi:hypothetical protein
LFIYSDNVDLSRVSYIKEGLNPSPSIKRTTTDQDVIKMKHINEPLLRLLASSLSDAIYNTDATTHITCPTLKLQKLLRNLQQYITELEIMTNTNSTTTDKTTVDSYKNIDIINKTSTTPDAVDNADIKIAFSQLEVC